MPSRAPRAKSRAATAPHTPRGVARSTPDTGTPQRGHKHEIRTHKDGTVGKGEKAKDACSRPVQQKLLYPNYADIEITPPRRAPLTQSCPRTACPPRRCTTSSQRRTVVVSRAPAPTAARAQALRVRAALHRQLILIKQHLIHLVHRLRCRRLRVCRIQVRRLARLLSPPWSARRCAHKVRKARDRRTCVVPMRSPVRRCTDWEGVEGLEVLLLVR